MKKNLKSSILAATSLTALTVQHQTEANNLVFTEGQLSALNNQNQLESSDASVLDFSKMTLETVGKLQGVTLDLSQFDKARNIIWPGFASKLNIILPKNFGQPQNDVYSRLTLVNAGVAPSTESDLSLDLSSLLNIAGKVTVDSTAVALKELISGSSAAKIVRNPETTQLTVSEKIEAIDTDGVIADGVKTSITVKPSVTSTDQTTPLFSGLPFAVIGANPSTLDISNYNIAGANVSLAGIKNLETLKVAQGDNIGTLTVTGETSFTTNATSIQKAEVTSTTPVQSVVDALATVATSIAVQNSKAFKDSYKGSKNLDFSKVDFGSVDATASRIKDVITDYEIAPLATIQTMKINSDVLTAVMSKLNITNLSSFSALKKLELIRATGVYQTTTLIASDLPSGLEEFYSSSLVVRKGTLSADLEFDKKFNAVTLDLSGLSLNGHTITIGNAFTASSVTHLKLNPSLLAVAATKNLIAVGSAKTITVSGSVSGALNTANLQNVGTIDLRTVTGATSFSAPLNVGGNNSNLSKLYVPSAFTVASSFLTGVNNGEVTIYLSGAYSGAQTLDASYDKTILNFSGVTGTGRFQIPSGIRGLIFSNTIKGINVGAAAIANEFDLSGLTDIRQITDLPTSATVLKLNNSAATSASELNLAAHTSLTTLQLGSSRISKLTLPATASLTDGGENEHLDLSDIKDFSELNRLNDLLDLGAIKIVSFPNNPASTFRINLATTTPGVQFNNLDKIPELTLDKDYLPGPGSNSMWPTVKNKTLSADWVQFFNYITGAVNLGGINSPSVFDLSGQAIETQDQADALVTALGSLSSISKNVIEKIIIRIDSATTGTINLSALTTTDFRHSSLKIIIDQSTGSTAPVTVPGGWTSKTKTHISLGQVEKETAASWTKYLDYHFASTVDKGEGATSLDLSSIDLTSAEWSALMTSMNGFATPEAIETISLKLVAADNYSLAPAFTTATLSAATSIIVDITGVKYSGSQVTVSGLPAVSGSLEQVEQRVTDASSVDRASESSWKGYIEKLLSNISGSNYTLDLTATDVQIQTADELTALKSALAAVSTANKAKIQNINLKIAAGDRSADFMVSTDFTDFTNIASLVVDATGALNGAAQSAVTFSLTNAPAYAKAHVTSLASVDTDVSTSWDYYLAYRLGTDGVGLANLDLSGVSLAAQADLTAFLTALEGQSGDDKLTVQSIKLKLATNYFDSSVDFSAGSVSGLSHSSFSVEVDRNGANIAEPVSFTFGTTITTSNTTIKDTAFTGLGSFDGAIAHNWLGYVRALLSTVASGTTTLDLSIHSELEMNNAKVAKFISGMNALPASDKAKIETLKIKLASGNFGTGAVDFSAITGLEALTSLIVERNGALASSTLSDSAVNVTEIGTTTINDPELRTVSATTETNKWLGYLRFVLNGMSGTTNTLDLSSFSVDSTNAATAFNNALQALPASEKLKIQTLKLSANTAVTLGTGVSGFDNLTTVIVDQTAAPTAAITIAAGTVATGEFADAATQKFYVTSASTAQNNNAWDKYIEYAMSSVSDGGLGLTAFDLTTLTLSNAEIGQFLTALNAHASVANVTAITLKLDPTFGADTLTLSAPAGFTSLTGSDAFKIYRNAAANSGTLVSIDYNGWDDSVVQIIDPTATAVADTAISQQWLGYLTGVLNDSASGATLDLSSIAIDSADAFTAFNTAVACLDSALSSKVTLLKLAVTHAEDITLGTGSAGFSNLARIEFTKTATNTVTFAGALSVGRTYLTNLASVKMDTTSDWTNYLNYMLSTTEGGQSATALNLNSRTFADQTAVDAFFAGLNALNGTGIYGDKASLTTLRMKLAGGLTAISIGRIDNTPTAASGLGSDLRVIVDPGTSTGTTYAGSNADEVLESNLIVLRSSVSFSKGHIAYRAEHSSFSGTIDLMVLSMLTADGATLTTALNALPADIQAKIKTINLKLTSGDFGGPDLQLGALTGFSDLTINVDRNGARAEDNSFGALVTLSHNTGQSVYLTDAEFQNMSTFYNESSAHWIGYLTHELNSAPSDYTLDLTVNDKLTLNSANSISALNAALSALPDNLKAKVALLNVKSSTSGELGTNVTEFSNLATIAVDYTAATISAMTCAFAYNSPTLCHYITTPFNGMDQTDWSRFFDYQLNYTEVGGLGVTDIVLNQRLSSADLTAVLLALDAASQIYQLQNLTLNLASDVTGDIDVGASRLSALNTVTLNTNGSAAKITPTNNFIGKTIFSSINNVKTNKANSWAAYLAGQSSLTAIDIREVELADQYELTAFLTALDAESRKADIETIKIKLASSYASTTDFSVDLGAGAISGLSNLDDAGVEIHRNGSAATATQGGDIIDVKIKLVDLTSSSLTDRSNPASWQSYLTALIEANPGAVDLSTDSDTYLRTNDHVTAFMLGLQNLSPANKLLVTSLKLELAPGATWSNITNLGQGLTGFNNLTSFIVDATGATNAGTQVTVAFHTDINAASPKAIVSSLASVIKYNQDSWTYFFNSAAMTSVDVSSITLTKAEADVFLAALGTGVTAKTDITALTMKLDPTFGNASLAVDANNEFTSLATLTVQRNGAVDTGIPVSITLTNTTAALSIVDPTITDADSVLKTSASSWLAYLTDALSGEVTELDLTDDNLVLSTTPQATALSAALDALDSNLKAKIVTLKVKAASNVTIGATLKSAAGFSALTAIELDKPTANTITVSTVDDTTQLRIADLANVTRDSSSDWLAYIQYLMKDLGTVTNYDLDMTATNLAEGEAQAFVDSLITISNNANNSGNRDKIQKVRLKLAPGAWTFNIANLGGGWNASMSNIDTFTVDATGATVGGTQLTVGFHADLTDQSEYTRAFVTDLNSVVKDSVESWEYYLNYVTRAGAAAFDVSSVTLTPAELSVLDTVLGTFSAANSNKLSSIHIKVSGAAGAATVSLTADLDAQTAINTAAKFIVDVSGFTHASSQAVVDHTGGGNPKSVELRISGASDLYRDSSASWGTYLNYIKSANNDAMPSILDLTGSSSLYLRSQADVNALMTALEARADKASINTLNVRLAPGNVGSDITFGNGLTGVTLTSLHVTATGAMINGTLLTSSDIRLAGSFTSAGKTVTQDFASTVADKTVEANWTSYFKYVLSSTADGGLGQISVVAPALTSMTEFTAMMTSLNGLSNELKASIQYLNLDVSDATFNGALVLGTGVTGLDNLVQVTYVRDSGVSDATAVGDFTNKLQRLRTAWNSDSLVSATTVEEYLRYVLMETAMGGAELTLVDLTPETLNNTSNDSLRTALGNLPSELLSRIIELRLKFNTSSDGSYATISLPNLTTVKYFQTGSADIVAPTSSQSVTTTRFRAGMDEVDKESPAQWGEYLLHKLASIAEGGLGETTLDVSSVNLSNDQVTHFWGGLREGALDAYRPNITPIKFAVDNSGGDVTLDGGGKTFNDTLKIIAIVNNKPSSTFTLGTDDSGFKNSLNDDLPDSIIEHRITSIAAVDRSSATSWGYYLNHLNATNGNIESIDLFDRDLYDTNQSTTEANVDAFFTALRARADRTTVKDIYLNISGVDNLALHVRTNLDELTALTSVVIQRHAGAGSTFIATMGIDETDLAVIDSTTTGLGNSGTVAQWKGYLAYLLEDAAHGGAYSGSDPITINLTASDVLISTNTVLGYLETAISELPARLKARISALVIKTLDDSTNLSQGNAFGDEFNASIADFSALKAVIIDASNTTTVGNKPAFPGAGDFFDASFISKIVY